MEERSEILYAKWLSGELTPEELSKLEKSGALPALEAVVGLADQLVMPDYDEEAAYAQLEKKLSTKERKVRRLDRRLFLGIAASLILFFVAINFFINRETLVEASFAANVSHELPDKSLVFLNDGSSILYKKNGWLERRKIKLTGQAFFDVEKGSKFVVETKHGKIEVLGTEFDVKAWGDQLAVFCYEGKVKVISKGQSTILSAKESVFVVKGKMEDKQVIQVEGPQWRQGISSFYKENINEVFAELERQFNIKVEAKSMDRVFTGVFEHYDMKAALNAVCLPMGLEFEIAKNGKSVQVYKSE